MCARTDNENGIRGGAEARVVSAHVQPLADDRTGGAVLGPKLADELWNLKEIYITENGCSSDDKVAPDGRSTTPIA